MTTPLNQTEGDQWLADISAGAGVITGLQRGGVSGDLQAGLGAAKLGASTGLLNVSPKVGNELGELGNVAGIYTGLKAGGVEGYGSAAINAGDLAERLGAISPTSGAGEAIPVLGDALAIYNFASNWQSGAAGSDALSGAETGATIGSAWGPIGTGIGAIAGGVIGAASSLFGPGETDPEQGTWGAYFNAFQEGSTQAYDAAQAPGVLAAQQLEGKYSREAAPGQQVNAPPGIQQLASKPAKLSGTALGTSESQGGAQAVSGAPPAATFQALSGLFDMRSSQLPFYNQFGRQGEGAFTNAMATQINTALAKGTIGPSDSAQTIFQKVVSPWIGSMPGGSTWTQGLNLANENEAPSNTNSYPAVANLLTQIIGQYQSGQLNSTTSVTVGGGSITGLPQFGAAGLAPAAAKAKQAVAQNVAPLQDAVTTMPTGVPASASASTGSSASSSMLPLMLAMPALFAGANSMSDPNNPGATTTSTGASDPTGAGAAASTSSDGGILSDLNSFLSSPSGALTESATLAGLGLAQANSQKGTNDALAGSLSTSGAPFTAAGKGELGQLEGGPAVGGPLGASITQQTDAAKELGNVANEYSTGNLTPAQQSQVQDYIKEQRAQVDTQLAASGTPAGSAQDAAYQQIDDNAAQLTQQLTNQNIQMGTAALTAVQSTYTGLLNQALSSSEFGFSTQLAAVQTQIQADTQLSASLNQLFAGIAQGYGNAVGGGAKTGSSAVGALGTAAGVAASAAGGGGGSSPGDAATGPFDENTASQVGVSPVDVNSNPEYQAIEQGQEDALQNSIDSSSSPTGSLDSFTENMQGQDVLSDFGGDPFGGLA